MPLSRRSYLVAAAAAGALLPAPALPRQATPEPREPLPPDVTFERLRDSVVTTPLFPSDTPEQVIVVWDDSSDPDLDDAIGGLLVQAGPGEDASLIGVYIVHPTIDQARSRLVVDGTDATTEATSVLGYSGVWQQSGPDEEDGYSLVAVSSGPVIISAIGEGGDPGANTLRALANLAGLLDHFRMATSG